MNMDCLGGSTRKMDYLFPLRAIPTTYFMDKSYGNVPASNAELYVSPVRSNQIKINLIKDFIEDFGLGSQDDYESIMRDTFNYYRAGVNNTRSRYLSLFVEYELWDYNMGKAVGFGFARGSASAAFNITKEDWMKTIKQASND
jgi:hypothetical protein